MEMETLIMLKLFHLNIRRAHFNLALGGFTVNKGYGLIGLIIALFIMFLCLDLLIVFLGVLG